MAEFSPAPSPAFSGIDFNPAFFPSTTSDYLEFPVAQGTETFGTIFATTIDTPTPSADFDFLDSAIGNINIGTSVPTLKTIKLGQSTGASIHCGSIDLQGTNINNAVASATGVISLGPAQTTGTLNIGSHPTTGTRTTGAINIGTNSVGATPITIGTTGQTTTTLNGTTVNVVTKLTTPALDASSDTAMTIGYNLTAGQLSIAQNQKTGLLNIGVSNDRSTTSGNINIGTGANVSSAINIGGGDTSSGSINIGQIGTTTGTTTVNIGTSTAGSHPVNIGSSSALTTIKGASTLTGAVAATVGIKTPYIEPSLATTDLELAAAQTSGDLYIGSGPRTSAADINLGTGQNDACNIYIGHKASVVSTQAVKINTSTAAGATGATTIGSLSSATSIGGTLSVVTKVSTPIIDCITDGVTGATSLSIGPSAVNGNIIIGAALGVGDVAIGAAQASGGTITLGSSNTTTTITGKLTTSNGTLAGGVAYQGVLLTAAYTVPTTINNRVCFLLYGAPASTTVTIPALSNYTAGQYITIRNNTGYNQKLITSDNLGLLGNSLFVTETIILPYGCIELFGSSTVWSEISNNYNSSPINLPLATTTPITTQLGYFGSNTNTTPFTVNNTNTAPASSTVTNLPIGIYMFNYYAYSYSPSIGATQVMTYSIITTGDATSNIQQFVFNGVATTFQSSQRLSGIIKCTTATNTIAMNFIVTSGGGTITASNYGYNYIKIA